MKFGELAKQSKPELVVSRRYEEWMQTNGNPTYSDRALKFCEEQLRLQATPRDRRGTVSASSLGSCRRRQVFTYLGWPELLPSSRLAGIFQNGTMMHIRWQMAGLTEGWLSEAEVPVGDNELRLSGTQDGIAHEGSIVELKSINSNGFRSVNSFGVKEEHRFQVGTYMVATGNEKSVVVYECKDTQEFREFVVPLSDELRSNVLHITKTIWDYIDNQELPEPLLACEEKTGWQYNGCQFRDRCLKAKNWAHAEEIK